MPANRLSSCKRLRCIVDKLFVICDLINRAFGTEPLLDIGLRKGGAEKGALHWVGLIDNSPPAGGVAFIVISGKRRAKRSAGIPSRWLNKDLAEAAIPKHFSICHAIERDAASK